MLNLIDRHPLLPLLLIAYRGEKARSEHDLYIKLKWKLFSKERCSVFLV